MAEGSSKSFPSGSGDGGRLVLDDLDIVEVSAKAAAGWSSGRQKRKRSQVAAPNPVPDDIIELDSDDDPDGVMIIGETASDHKNNKTFGFHMNWPNHAKSSVAEDVAGPSVVPATNVFPWNGLGGFHQNVAGPSYISATHFYPWGGSTPAPSFCFDQFVEAYGKEGYASNLEAPINYYGNNNALIESGSSLNLDANYYMSIPSGVEAALPWGHMTSAEMPHQPSQIKIADNEIELASKNNEVDEKFKAFKQFDTVTDHSDHFYSLQGKKNVQAVKKPSKAWVKRIQHEWKVLEKDLPDTIFVRVYEDRMDLLRAVIVGPAGTPYHDGLFFFDVYFPSRYPSKPPLVNYRSGGLRLNPNLYECGKVCLSLLNTWAGSGCEKWHPSNSTMLQVLVSIQALVLNAKPYFNEPGNVVHAHTLHGEKFSMAYNEEVFLLSCRTITYSLRNPPKHFEDFTVGHFCNYGRKILNGCKAYMSGAQVGCLVGDGVQDVDEGDKSCSNNFKASLRLLFENLLKEFTNIGVDCGEFHNPGAAKATKADTILRL